MARSKTSIAVTTGNTLEGYEIDEYLGVVRGIVVRAQTITQGIRTSEAVTALAGASPSTMRPRQELSAIRQAVVSHTTSTTSLTLNRVDSFSILPSSSVGR